ncbi:hypothetical protein A3765_13410 [Oleiphilus sp. HI0130]|nr:hypothetical protein A3744_11810 [Oleiphilus sp. HI0073]KZZ39855.1 hypothetical protein A3758_25220 [Oleiphilus sp. HI0118]KZZ48250.1 hypothetical protein A3760_04275 [Oleiphilus sp. HI0122]KZZ72132.1 hypothetical protein A3765_13410 [Oleiphilus sp. HI0130]KZZ03120.1 hypothetical protein A3744_27100 [Oleiphilus sp. HI0073]
MDAMDTQDNTPHNRQHNTLIALKKLESANSASSMQATRVQIAPVEWEMSAHEALEVNYLTRTNRSINAH